jgi:hypothetical protein
MHISLEGRRAPVAGASKGAELHFAHGLAGTGAELRGVATRSRIHRHLPRRVAVADVRGLGCAKLSGPSLDRLTADDFLSLG